ncbi:MAG: protein TonB [Arcticibacterium sp.]
MISKEYLKKMAKEVFFDEPIFKDGIEKMNMFISKKVKYPKLARKRNIQGQVLLKFIIEKDGSMGEITILKRASPLLDIEAKRVVSIMPNWILGNRDGEPIRIYYTIPIIFRLY